MKINIRVHQNNIHQKNNNMHTKNSYVHACPEIFSSNDSDTDTDTDTDTIQGSMEELNIKVSDTVSSKSGKKMY